MIYPPQFGSLNHALARIINSEPAFPESPPDMLADPPESTRLTHLAIGCAPRQWFDGGFSLYQSTRLSR
jgi:hypothetical protein